MLARRIRRFAAVVLAVAAVENGTLSSAQDAIDLRGRLDTSPGGTLLGNRPGMSIGRTPTSAFQRQDMLPRTRPDQLVPASTIPDFPVLYSPEKPGQKQIFGDLDAMTLETAIYQMVVSNPDIAAARTEVEQARADVVTAGLRANPQFFTDMQQVPYRVLAPNQVDVNLAYPTDVSGKRKTQVKSAICVLRSVEWKYQNFVRAQRDNLYTLFVDALVAQEMEKDYAPRLSALKRVIERDDDALSQRRKAADEAWSVLLEELEFGLPSAALISWVEDAEYDVLEQRRKLEVDIEALNDRQQEASDARDAFRDKRMALALLLNRSDADAIRVRGMIYDDWHFGDTAAEAKQRRLAWLKQIAFENRPDLQAQRWNLCRALADLDAVRASRFGDVTFLVQPYTYSPILVDRVGWAAGVTVPMPIFNRQQGNLVKAQQIIVQTQAQLTSLENSIATEVEAAYNAVDDTWADMERFRLKGERLVIRPDFRPVEIPADQATRRGLNFLNIYVRELKFRDRGVVTRQYYNAIVQHQKSLLRMNTACVGSAWATVPTASSAPSQCAAAWRVTSVRFP
jgi:cobalt-zinc-cadmium efflux system outer membrane protein